MYINYLDKLCNSKITNLSSKRNNFDEGRFIEWLEENQVQSKTNPSAYVNKVFLKELEAGRFDKVVERPQRTPTKKGVVMVQPIFNAMREHGIEVIPNDTLKIDVMLNKLVNDLEIDPTELTSLNHLLIDTPLISNTTEYIAKLIENYPEVEKHD